MSFSDAILALFDLSQPVGFTEEGIQQAENKLGLSLPDTVREYYQQLGAYLPLNHAFDRFLAPEDLYITASGFLVFYEENQQVVLWGIDLKDIGSANPPVYGSYDEGTSWMLDADTCTDFLLGMAYWQAVMGALPYSANNMALTPDDTRLLQGISTDWIPVSLAIHWGASVFLYAQKQVIYICTDEVGTWQSICIGATTHKAFSALLDKLPVSWDYRSDEDEE